MAALVAVVKAAKKPGANPPRPRVCRPRRRLDFMNRREPGKHQPGGRPMTVWLNSRTRTFCRGTESGAKSSGSPTQHPPPLAGEGLPTSFETLPASGEEGPAGRAEGWGLITLLVLAQAAARRRKGVELTAWINSPEAGARPSPRTCGRPRSARRDQAVVACPSLERQHQLSVQRCRPPLAARANGSARHATVESRIGLQPI